MNLIQSVSQGGLTSSESANLYSVVIFRFWIAGQLLIVRASNIDFLWYYFSGQTFLVLQDAFEFTFFTLVFAILFSEVLY